MQWRSRSGDRTGGASRGPQKLSRFSQKKNLSPPHRHHGADHNTPIPVTPENPAQPKSYGPFECHVSPPHHFDCGMRCFLSSSIAASVRPPASSRYTQQSSARRFAGCCDNAC